MKNLKLIKTRLINIIMLKGKKNKSEVILFNNFKSLQKQTCFPLDSIIKLSIINSSPYFQLKEIKKKKFIKFPFLLKKNNRITYSLRKITEETSKAKFYDLILSSANKEGNSVNYKKQLHKESFIKKKMSNYRWFI